MGDPTYSIGAFALIFNTSDSVLLALRTDMDFWNLPGGGVKEGESPEVAVVREVREEVGLDVVVDRIQGVYVKPGQHDIAFSYWCRVVGGALQESDEAQAIAWFTREDLPENLRPKHRDRILDALSSSQVITYRVYPGTP